MMKWTNGLDATLASLYPTMPASEIAARLGCTRAAVKGRVSKLGLKKPDGSSNTGCFARGSAPWNKGAHFIAGGRSAETRFKPGHSGGRAAQIRQPVGAKRLNKDGYLQTKVSDDPVFYQRWKFDHIVLWQSVHGPVPKGHAIAFINGDKADIRIDNLECISRRDLMLRNTVHNYPDELRQLMRLKATITRKINKTERENKQP